MKKRLSVNLFAILFFTVLCSSLFAGIIMLTPVADSDMSGGMYISNNDGSASPFGVKVMGISC